MGALTSRAFAAIYPDEIAGLALVDPRDFDIVALTYLTFARTAGTMPLSSASLATDIGVSLTIAEGRVV